MGPRWLSGHPRPGVLAGHAPLEDPLEANLIGSIDDHSRPAEPGVDDGHLHYGQPVESLQLIMDRAEYVTVGQGLQFPSWPGSAKTMPASLPRSITPSRTTSGQRSATAAKALPAGSRTRWPMRSASSTLRPRRPTIGPPRSFPSRCPQRAASDGSLSSPGLTVAFPHDRQRSLGADASISASRSANSSPSLLPSSST